MRKKSSSEKELSRGHLAPLTTVKIGMLGTKSFCVHSSSLFSLRLFDGFAGGQMCVLVFKDSLELGKSCGISATSSPLSSETWSEINKKISN